MMNFNESQHAPLDFNVGELLRKDAVHNGILYNSMGGVWQQYRSILPGLVRFLSRMKCPVLMYPDLLPQALCLSHSSIMAD